MTLGLPSPVVGRKLRVQHAGAIRYDVNGRLTNRWSKAKGDTAHSYDAAGDLALVNYPTDRIVSLEATRTVLWLVDSGLARRITSAEAAVRSECGGGRAGVKMYRKAKGEGGSGAMAPREGGRFAPATCSTNLDDTISGKFKINTTAFEGK